MIQETRAIYHLDNNKQIADLTNGTAGTLHANFVSRDFLESVQQELIDRDIIIFVENTRNNGRRHPDNMYLENIVKKIDGFKNVFICYDLAHAMINEEPMEQVVKYKDYIKHIHLTDTNIYADRHWPLYKGSLDIDKFMRILGEIDYKGIINIERWEGIRDSWGSHTGKDEQGDWIG